MRGVEGPARELGIGADLDLDQLVRVLGRRGLAGWRRLDLPGSGTAV